MKGEGEMIRIQITSTGKSYNPRDKFSLFGERTETVADMREAKQWLRDTYGKAKRAPMYIDTKGGTKKVGYVIGFRNADWSHSPVNKWIQQDWVSFHSQKPIYL
jgi:hypothetical protein